MVEESVENLIQINALDLCIPTDKSKTDRES